MYLWNTEIWTVERFRIGERRISCFHLFMKTFFALIFVLSIFERHSFADDLLGNDQQRISTESYFVGGFLGTFPGFGLGHVAQGQWQQRGWIITTAEFAGLALMLNGLSRDNSSFGTGAALYFGFRLYEVLDVWIGPPLRHQIGFVPPTSKNPGMLALRLEF